MIQVPNRWTKNNTIKTFYEVVVNKEKLDTCFTKANASLYLDKLLELIEKKELTHPEAEPIFNLLGNYITWCNIQEDNQTYNVINVLRTNPEVRELDWPSYRVLFN